MAYNFGFVVRKLVSIAIVTENLWIFSTICFSLFARNFSTIFIFIPDNDACEYDGVRVRKQLNCGANATVTH